MLAGRRWKTERERLAQVAACSMRVACSDEK